MINTQLIHQLWIDYEKGDPVALLALRDHLTENDEPVYWVKINTSRSVTLPEIFDLGTLAVYETPSRNECLIEAMGVVSYTFDSFFLVHGGIKGRVFDRYLEINEIDTVDMTPSGVLTVVSRNEYTYSTTIKEITEVQRCLTNN